MILSVLWQPYAPDGRDTYCFGPSSTARPKHIRCQRGAAPPQENEGRRCAAATPLAERGRATDVVLRRPEEGLRVRRAERHENQTGARDATRSVGESAASAINAVRRDECKFGDLSRADRSANPTSSRESEYKFATCRGG